MGNSGHRRGLKKLNWWHLDQLPGVLRGTRQPRLPGLLSKRNDGALVLGVFRQFGIWLVHAGEQGVPVTIGGQHRITGNNLTSVVVHPVAPQTCQHPRQAVTPTKAPPDIGASLPARFVIAHGGNQASLAFGPCLPKHGLGGHSLRPGIVGHDLAIDALLSEGWDQRPLAHNTLHPSRASANEGAYPPWTKASPVGNGRDQNAQNVMNLFVGCGLVAVAHEGILAVQHKKSCNSPEWDIICIDISKGINLKKLPVQNAVDLSTAASAGAALSIFRKIGDAWGLMARERQILLGVSKSTWYRWEEGAIGAGLDSATLERLSYIMRIYAALQMLLPIQERAAAWPRAANTAPLFGGRSALDRMLGGQVGDLMVVADYLDAQRGGDFA